MPKITQIDPYTFGELVERRLKKEGLSKKISVDIEGNGPHMIQLASITSWEPRKGYGNRAMKIICELADQHRFNIILRPAGNEDGSEDDDGTMMNMTQLIQWYQRFGFEKLLRNDGDIQMLRDYRS